MRSDSRAPLGLTLGAAAGLLFLHVPILLIFLYAFTTEERTYQFPPPGLTLKWFAVAWNRADIWPPLYLSLWVASIATVLAMILGTLVSAAMARASCCEDGRMAEVCFGCSTACFGKNARSANTAASLSGS